MTNARNVLRGFDLAGPAERKEIIRGLVDRLSVDEAECFAQARLKHDIFGHDRMPLEIRLMIVQYLDITDVYNCALLVCRKWKKLLMDFTAIAEDVLQKWFPCLYEKDMPREDVMELFSQSIVRLYLRDTGRFQSRLTWRFIYKPNDEHHIIRIEGLQQGHTFRDLLCTASLSDRFPPSSVSPISTTHPAGTAANVRNSTRHVSNYLYRDGRLAWQITGSDPGSSVIFFHDLHGLHAQQPRMFQLPRQRVQGTKLRLEALGDELIVATVMGQRKLCAQDFQSQTIDSITLPATLDKCITQGQSVLMNTIQGDLLLWTFLRGVTQIDTSTMPQSREAYCGPSKPHLIPSPPLTRLEVQFARYFFHPQDIRVFFLVEHDIRADTGWLSVYEFRDRLCSRIFTYSFASPLEFITHESSSWDKLEDYDDIWESPWEPDFDQKADAHGTYVLLGLGRRFDDAERRIYVMFNTLSTSFSGRMFERFEEPTGYRSPLKEPALVWNGQLCVQAKRFGASHSRASYPSLLLVLKSKVSHKGKWSSPQWKEDQPAVVTHQEEEQDKRQLRVIQEEMLTNTAMQQLELYRTFCKHAGRTLTPKKDTVRYQDISRTYPQATDFRSELGLLYTCSFYGGGCSFAGPHSSHCTQNPPGPPPGRAVAPGTGSTRHLINHPAHGDDGAWSDVQVAAILGDDDFLVVATTQGFYTVFAVDADRTMAKSLKEGGLTQIRGHD